MNSLLRILLSVISLPVFSRLYGRVMRLRRPRFLVRELIDFFKDLYKIEMDDYQGEAGDYASLGEFFIRPFDPQKRPLKPRGDGIVSPADGVLSNVETIYEDRAVQVKGIDYPVSKMLRRELDFSRGWHVATIYLSPYNYHRFHYPVSGKITGYCHVRGRLFPVNSHGMTLIKKLFIRNERIVTRFESNGLPVFAVAVGATFVGSIKMLFIDKIKRDGRWKELDLEVEEQGEMGRFEMGSTIVLVVPEELGKPAAEKIGQAIKVGETVIAF
ncbi:MAG: phosphatidylserine decarboxylase [Candidatus Aminicenantes bacterium]|nr:phosphatidylserine decarboxylase [Candidatus Aminicenantes bacterium]